MDLADLWQQHKKFILAVAGALLLLLIGGGWLSAHFPYEDVRRDIAKTATNLARSDEVADAAVRALQAEVDDLRARDVELTSLMRFQPASQFVLAPGEANPRKFFWDTLRRMQSALVDAAEKEDIRVPEKLGLKETTPTEPEEIRRTLVALNVIQQVLVQAIAGNIRRIEAIRIDEEQKARGKASALARELRVEFDIVGSERSIRLLIEGLVDGAARKEGPYLAVDRATIKGVKGEEGMQRLALTLLALQIEKSDDEEEAR